MTEENLLYDAFSYILFILNYLRLLEVQYTVLNFAVHCHLLGRKDSETSVYKLLIQF